MSNVIPPPVPTEGEPLSEEDFAESLSPPWPKMDPAAYYGLAGEVVETIAPHTEADRVAILLTLLTLFGNVVGPEPHAMAGGSKHPGRLNVLLVGNTAKARKGTSLATTLPLFEQADPSWAGDRMRSGFGSGESLVEAVADRDPDDESDAPAKDRRLVVIEGEFARILAAIAREGSTLSPIMRDAWDGRPLEAHRLKVRHKSTGAHISVLAHCTIDELRAKVSGNDIANGFLNRYLLASVRRSSELLPFGGQVPEDAMERLAQKTRDAVTIGKSIRSVGFGSDAIAPWEDLYRRLVEDEPPGIVGMVTARAEANTLRLAVAYALLDGTGEVSSEHVRAAEAVWRYCAESVRYIWAGEHTGNPIAEKLLSALKAAEGRWLTGTEQHKALGGHTSAEDLTFARDELERRGLVETEQVGTAGRRALRTRARTLTVREKREKRRKPPVPDLSSHNSLRSQPEDTGGERRNGEQAELFPEETKSEKFQQWTR